MLNLFRGLVVQEEIRRGRSRCDGIDRNVAAAHFLGKDVGQGFNPRLGRRVYGVAGQSERLDAAREVDDSSTPAQFLGSHAHRIESTLEIDRHQTIEEAVVRVASMVRPGWMIPAL